MFNIKIGNIIIGKELVDFPFAWVGPVRGKKHEVGTVFVSESPSTHKPRINYFTFDENEQWIPRTHPHIDITKFKDENEFEKVLDFKIKHELLKPKKVYLKDLSKVRNEIINNLVTSSKIVEKKIRLYAKEIIK